MESTCIVDVAIIGAGTAGQSAFEQINKVTDSVVIINEGYWTTTCATVGCMPSKLIISAAERAHHAIQSEEFGIGTIRKSNIDGKQVMFRVQNIRNRFTNSVKKSTENWDDAKKIEGKAILMKDQMIKVKDKIIKYKYLIIATGTKPFIPDILKNNFDNMLLTSDTIFEMQDLPDKMAVVGAGAVGIELAQAFNRLGVEVTLLNHTSKIAGINNKTINQKVIDCISKELTLHLKSKITHVDIKNGKAIIKFKDTDNQERIWQGDKVLVATGRRHVLEELGIDKLNIELNDDKTPKNVNKITGQVAKSNIFIVGDTSTHMPILHMANYVGKNAGKVVASLLHNKKSQLSFKELAPMSIVFTKPQIASVGSTFDSLKDNIGNKNIITGSYNFESQGRSIIEDSNCGLIHLYAHKQTGKILGACMIAPDAEYIAHLLANAITNGQTVQELLNTPFYHPTILEGLRNVLLDVLQQISKDQ